MNEVLTINGKRYETKQVLGVWNARREEGEKALKEFLPQVRINRKFFAGKQHLQVNIKDGRVLELPKRHRGVELVESNILDQFVLTVLGRLAGSDFKSNFTSAQESEVSDAVTRQMNDAFGWGWEHEWKGDQKVLQLWRYLLIDGTCAVRCRYDRRKGDIVGDEVPFKNGLPITDEEERRKYVAEQTAKGELVEFGVLREGEVSWELFTMENLLWPPGYDDAGLFPWLVLRRPVSVDELKNAYGKRAEEVVPEEIEGSESISSGLGFTEQSTVRLEGRAFVYTGYEMPNDLHPKGRTVIFTKDILLDVIESLPYSDHPRGPSNGVHFFRWQVVPGRFPGKAFIENGLGPQKVLNKRLTQINAIMDRGLPKVAIEEQSLARPHTGEPMEILEVRPGSPLPQVLAGINPGSWMMEDIKLQIENAERALGIRGVTMGQAPQGVSAYSAMALLSENDSLKLDPVAHDFRLTMNDLCWDTMEAMRNWPPSRQILISGPGGSLRSFLYNGNNVPYEYLASIPSGGALPRSQASEIQKITDIWQASGGQLPLSWYVESLEAGKAQPLPASAADSDSHKAELENVLMQQTGQAPPVAPYDNHEKHGQAHRAMQTQLQTQADLGDPEAAQTVQVFEQHIQEHLARAAENAPPPMNPGQMAPPGPPIPSQPPQQGLPPSPMG